MEASNKDLARARFKQQRRDAFRDGRGRGGRGRGRGRSGPFDDVDADEDEAPETTRGDERNAPRPEIDLPPDEDDERVDADGNVRPRSKGADLGALFAECDQAALPRQHASAYLDPSWAVDDLAALERVALGGGPGNIFNTYGELSLDPAALARQLRALPLADLLGLSEDYRECAGDRGSRAGGTDDPAPGATVAGDDGRLPSPTARTDHRLRWTIFRQRTRAAEKTPERSSRSRGRVLALQVKRKRVVDAKTATTTPSLTRCWTAPPAKNLGESDGNTRDRLSPPPRRRATRTTRS